MNTRTKLFIASERGKLLRIELLRMTKSRAYNTKSTYSTLDATGLTFVEKHMRYMSQYPTLNYEQYISNVKLMTKINVPA